jgi:hypothetical protein
VCIVVEQAIVLRKVAELRRYTADGTLDWGRLLIEAPRHLDALERFAARVAELTP